MSRFFLRIYDVLIRHRMATIVGLLVLVGILAGLSLRIDYEEDIAKFLPSAKNTENLKDFQSQAEHQSRIAVIFSMKDTTSEVNIYSIESAITYVGELISKDKSLPLQLTADETYTDSILRFVYTNSPYFLTPKDSARITRLLCDSTYIRKTLAQDKEQLILTNGMAMSTLQYDPLHLFNPVMQRFQKASPAHAFQLVDGYIFTKDGKHALLTFDDPYGSSETHKNAELAKQLDLLLVKANAQYPSLTISAIGAPLVAVTNAQQIKADSLIVSCVAILLILALLFWHYRRLQDILWIGVTIAFGWLFALAGMSLFCKSVSIIVLGIGSVIIGIAVNYPLHFLDYLREEQDKREALKGMVSPLLIGNITTVAAFLCLVFLDAQAMRDLGLFGGFMLIGTILFVLIFLPVFATVSNKPVHHLCLGKIYNAGRSIAATGKHIITDKWIFPIICVVTLILGYFSLDTYFDSNLQHINYMTDIQRYDMSIMSPDKTTVKFLPKQETYSNRFVWREMDQLRFDEALKAEGFSSKAFVPFLTIIDKSTQSPVKQYSDFKPMLNKIETPDTHSAASELVEILNDSFNYVGFVCGFVVFLFLWISFHKIELAVTAFLPMAVSWIWILGLMDIFGIQFNIVNIILATFIFGQGDDYTIFITEGLLYEYTTGKKRLEGYKHSVMMSAVLMFIGMGCLAFARHPALRSLGLVTVIGMATVVLMAYYLPPIVFHFLTRQTSCNVRSAAFRITDKLPITLQRLGYSLFSIIFFLLMMYLFVLPYTWLYFHIGKLTEERKLRYHIFLQKISRWIIHHVPGVKFRLDNSIGEKFDNPAVIICNHQSHLDLMCLMMLTPKIVFMTNDWVWHNPFYGSIIHHAEFYPVSDGVEKNMERLRDLYHRGYSVCIFPEGTRSIDNNILPFHEGAFYLAQQLDADILRIFLHGVGHVLPKKDFMLRKGSIYVQIERRISKQQWADSNDPLALLHTTKKMHHYYIDHYKELCDRLETEEYLKPYRHLSEYYKLDND